MFLSVDLLSYYFQRSGWLRFISTFLLFYSQIIASEFLLGIFSSINGLNITLLNIAVSLSVIIFLYRKSGKKLFEQYIAVARQSITTFCKDLKSDPLSLTLLLLAVGFVLWIIFLGVIFPAIDSDGNSYHLTFIGYVLQNHNFFDVPTSITWLSGYPKGGEFIQMWSVVIARNDMLSDLAQLPFLLLGIYALYEVAVALGAKKKHARFSAILLVFLPIVLNQLKTTYVDVMLCTLFFATIAMVIRKKFNNLDFLLIGILFSLLISVKSTGFLFVLVALPLLFWNLGQSFGKKSEKDIKNYLKAFLIMALPTFFGLYWYIKNLVLYGSPLYPFGYKLAGFSIFPGKTFQEFAADAIQSTSLPNGCFQRIWFVWTERKDWFGCLYNYDANYTGFGPIWFIILIPAIIISIYFAVKKRNSLYLAITATIIALFAIYPSNYYSRYSIFITALGIFALSIVLSNISNTVGNLTKVITILLAISVIATNFVLCNFSPLVVKDQVKSLIKGSERGAIYSNKPGASFVFIENVMQPGEVVAYDSKPYFIYPLWKPDFSNKVLYIPANDEDTWYRELAKNNIKYVFTTTYSKENKWAKSKLKMIFKDDIYEIYQSK